MKHTTIFHPLAALVIALTFISPSLPAQVPPWEYINNPAMTGYAKAALNASNRLFFVSGERAAITGYPNPSTTLITMNVPHEELAQVNIALDDSTRPWMITDKSFYRARRYYNTWKFTAEPWKVQTLPLFFTVTPEGMMFVTDPFGGALRSTDEGRSWRHVGPPGAGRAQGLLRMADASLFMHTPSKLYRSSDGGDKWTEVALPEGTSSIAQVAADGTSMLLSGKRRASRFIMRRDIADSDWEDLAPPIPYDEEVRDVSGFNGAVLLFVTSAHRTCALHLPAGEAAWQRIDDLPLPTLHYIFDNAGNVLLTGPGIVEFLIEPGHDRAFGFLQGDVTDDDAMLCVDEQTFVCYKYDDGFYRSTNGGANWVETYDYESVEPHELVFGSSRSTMYCAFDEVMFLSTDGGVSWKQNVFENAYLSRVAETASGGVFLMARNSDSILRSTDFGTSWTEVRAATGRYDSLRLHAVGDRLYLFVDDGLEYSDDFGATWHEVEHFRLDLKPSRLFIVSENLMFACYDPSGITEDMTMFSTDMGATWHQTMGTLWATFEDIQWVPGSSTLYGYRGLVCQEDLYVSHDLGRNWERVEGPLSINIQTIRLSRQGHLVISASDMNQQGHFLLKNAAVMSAGHPPAAEQSRLSIWPQPARDFIRMSQHEDADISHCEVRDMLGRTVLSPSVQVVRSARIATHTLPTGQYFLVIRSHGEISVGKFRIQR